MHPYMHVLAPEQYGFMGDLLCLLGGDLAAMARGRRMDDDEPGSGVSEPPTHPSLQSVCTQAYGHAHLLSSSMIATTACRRLCG